MSLWTGKVLGPASSIYHDAAVKYSLELSLVLAISEIESSFYVSAYNPEPKWIYFWDVSQHKPWRKPTSDEVASELPPSDFPNPANIPKDSEWWGQQASFGLMQVMGAVARELGCTSRFLTELTADPILAVDLGCRFLSRLIKKYPTIEDAISSFNAGHPTWKQPDGNLVYVRKVTKARLRYQGE